MSQATKRKIRDLIKPVVAPTVQPEGSGWVLVDKMDRKVLGEGRNMGIGYAFARRDGRTLTTVDPISPCKDYLSDRALVQARGGTYSACGLTCTKINDLFDTHAYLIASVCKQGCRALVEYPAYKQDIAAFESNYPTMQAAINWFEDQLKIDGRTRIERIAANQYVIIAPLYWTQYTYLISLYTLIIRAALYHKEGDIKTYLTTGLKDGDAYTIKQAWPRIERLFAGELPKQDFGDKNVSWHGAGICWAQWPPDPKAPPVAPKSPTPTMTFGYVTAAHTVLIPAVPKPSPIAPAQIAAAQKA